jgi:hypothetical protein
MEIQFKRGAQVIASPSRGESFRARVVRRYDTRKGQFVVVKDGTGREVNMRPGLLRLA